MSNLFEFESEKAIEVLLYIAKRCPDMYNALKVLYFADKDHLSRYGRLICGDSYVAMSHGPVPSGVYDLIKHVRDGGCFADNELASQSFAMEGFYIRPLREPDLEELSDSDIECLDAAIEKYGRMSFGQLKGLSHADPTYQAADENDFISPEILVKSLPKGELLWDYLCDR